MLPEPDDFTGWDKAREKLETVATTTSDSVIRALRTEVIETQLGNVAVLDVRPNGWINNGKVIVGIHGGAWVFYSARSTAGVAALIAEATGTRVVSVDYTVAPRGKWPQAIDEVIAVIVALVDIGRPLKDIALFGDSAGANLATAVSLKMRDLGMGMPAAVAMWSPCVDFFNTADTRATLQDADPIVCYPQRLENAMLAYTDRSNWRNPYVSPIYGDFSKGFPPSLIQVGTREILLSDAVRLYQAIDSSNGEVKLDVYEGMTHVFQAFMPDAPEAKMAFKKIKAFMDAHLKGRSE